MLPGGLLPILNITVKAVSVNIQTQLFVKISHGLPGRPKCRFHPPMMVGAVKELLLIQLLLLRLLPQIQIRNIGRQQNLLSLGGIGGSLVIQSSREFGVTLNELGQRLHVNQRIPQRLIFGNILHNGAYFGGVGDKLQPIMVIFHHRV